MRPSYLSFTGTSFLALAMAPAALADVTADEVWTNLQAPAKALGAVIEAQTARDGNTLNISDLTMRYALPFDSGEIRIGLSGYALQENADGTVSATYPGTSILDFALETTEEGIVASGTVEMDGAAIAVTATGSPGDITYTSVTDGAGFRLTTLDVADDPDLDMQLEGLFSGAGSYRIVEGDIVRVESRAENGEMRFTSGFMDQTGARSEGRQTLTGGTSSVTMDIPAGRVNLLNLSNALRDGLRVNMQLDGGRLDASTVVTLDGEQVMDQTYAYTMDTMTYSVDENGLAAEGTYSDLSFNFVLPDMPLPLTGRMASTDGKLVLPLNRTEEPAEAALLMAMNGVELDETIWSMFDPGAQLPRDPATISLDLTGQVEAFIDLLDVGAWMAMENSGEMPAVLNDLTLNGLTLSAAGAALTGQGSFAIDNEDYQTFPGMPAPSGSLDLRLEGGNGLLDRLVAMGLLPEEQATGARMMMGLFGRPAEGEDTITSTIEVTEDGQILANGQRLK